MMMMMVMMMVKAYDDDDGYDDGQGLRQGWQFFVQNLGEQAS
jgi:hypothetical protein